MSLPVTPSVMEGAYEYLRTWPMFKTLPEASEVEFTVIRSTRVYGHYTQRDDHAIYLSSSTNGLSETLLKTMAHEMVHQVLRLRGDPKFWQHGANFKSLAKRVCKCAGWDIKAF